MAHIHEKIDFTVEVFIVHQNKVLLRMHDKYHFWCSVGGHIELDEDPIQAACREAKEETGLDIKILPTKALAPESENYFPLIAPEGMYRNRINEVHEHIAFVYFATTDTDQFAESVLDHESGVEMRWFSLADLETVELRPDIRFYATEALQRVGK